MGPGSSGRGGNGIGGASAGGGGAQPGTGGVLGSSGAVGHGGKDASCELQECFVANICLDKCGGKVVSSGCCPCEPPSVNKLTCPGLD